MTGQEMAECGVPDKLTMVSYISQVYESFRGEIPVGELNIPYLFHNNTSIDKTFSKTQPYTAFFGNQQLETVFGIFGNFLRLT